MPHTVSLNNRIYCDGSFSWPPFGRKSLWGPPNSWEPSSSCRSCSSRRWKGRGWVTLESCTFLAVWWGLGLRGGAMGREEGLGFQTTKGTWRLEGDLTWRGRLSSAVPQKRGVAKGNLRGCRCGSGSWDRRRGSSHRGELPRWQETPKRRKPPNRRELKWFGGWLGSWNSSISFGKKRRNSWQRIGCCGRLWNGTCGCL